MWVTGFYRSKRRSRRWFCCAMLLHLVVGRMSGSEQLRGRRLLVSMEPMGLLLRLDDGSVWMCLKPAPLGWRPGDRVLLDEEYPGEIDMINLRTGKMVRVKRVEPKK